jgi:hypothetical protein
MEELNRRVGMFFTVLGFVLLALFFASDVQGEPAGKYLLWGTLTFFGGIYLAWKGRRQPKKAERFRMVRKLTGSGAKSKEDGEDKGEEGGENEVSNE